jgi:hypothetical protein
MVVLASVAALSVGGYAVAQWRSGVGASELPSGWTSYAPLGAAARAASSEPPQLPTEAEQRYIDLARRQTIARDPRCTAPVNNQRGATSVHRVPPRALLSVLGVLRRPALPADRSTRMLMRNGFDAGAGVYVDFIRRARTAYGKSFYVIPEARIGMFGPIPGRCYREMRGALQRDLRAAPPSLRAPTLRAQAQEFAIQRLEARQQQGLCFAAVSLGFHGRLGGVDEGCSPGVPNVRNPLGGGVGEGDRAGGTIFAAVVPDIVAGVTLEFSAGHGDPARAISSRAINNVVVFKIPQRTAHQQFPSHVILRATDGHILPTPNAATTGNPRPRAAARANPASSGARPDRRLVSLLAVFRRPPDAADRSPSALKAAAATHTDPRYIRYVGPGLLGGKIFLYPVRDVRDALLGNSGRPRGREDPGVCLTTAGALPVAGQIGGCTSLRDLTEPTSHWGAGEILPGPQGEQVFDNAGVPPQLRHGSLLGGVVRDGITTIDVYDRDHVALVVHVHNNAAYFHVNHSAPAAVYMRLVFKDADGRIVHARDS